MVEAVPSAKLLASSTAWPSILGALVVALAALPVVFFLARSLSRPLVQMTRAVEAFARGITVPSPVNADGEIGVLARSFTRMADQMRTQTATLTREIEDRRRIFNTSLDLIVVLDEQDNFVQVSPSSRGILDYAPEELIGRNLASFVHTQDIDALRAEMRVSRHKPTRNFETRFVHKNGALITLTWNGTWSEGTREHFLIGRDMTEAKAVQEALLDSERIAEGIIAHSLDAIIQLNEWGEVIEWNPQAETMLGWTRKEAVGQPISDLYLPSGYAPRYLAMNEQLRRQQPIIGVRFEFDARCKDGRTIKVEVSMTGVRSRDGNVFNLFLRDITQKLAAEEQLRQAQKMEAVGQLTGGIAHDFNNMLTVITGTIDILADAVADKPELASIARLIGEAADRGAELTSHLLAFARKQPLQPRDTDVNTLVWNSAKLLKPALGEKVEIELRLSEDAWPALVDANQLVTALLNLSVNARDAMPGGGKLTLESRNVVLDEAYCQSNGDVRPGNYVMIAVSDTGHGIPKSLLDKIFEPFFSTKDVGKGTGLGLSMVYGFVKQSGGHIKAYSEEGHGTTIRMYLPQAGAEPVEAAATDAAAGMAERQRNDPGGRGRCDGPHLRDHAAAESRLPDDLGGQRRGGAGDRGKRRAFRPAVHRRDPVEVDERPRTWRSRSSGAGPAPRCCSRPATPRTRSSTTGGSTRACCCWRSRIGNPSWRGCCASRSVVRRTLRLRPRRRPRGRAWVRRSHRASECTVPDSDVCRPSDLVSVKSPGRRCGTRFCFSPSCPIRPPVTSSAIGQCLPGKVIKLSDRAPTAVRSSSSVEKRAARSPHRRANHGRTAGLDARSFMTGVLKAAAETELCFVTPRCDSSMDSTCVPQSADAGRSFSGSCASSRRSYATGYPYCALPSGRKPRWQAAAKAATTRKLAKAAVRLVRASNDHRSELSWPPLAGISISCTHQSKSRVFRIYDAGIFSRRSPMRSSSIHLPSSPAQPFVGSVAQHPTIRLRRSAPTLQSHLSA